jgi:AraC family transcriptional regulator
MRLIRWAAPRRVLSAALVREDFGSLAAEILLFAFTTDAMTVGEHAGNFSVKFVTRGAERYRIGRRDVLLEPGHVLIANAGEDYSSAIDRRGTRAISCFLPAAAVSSALAFLTRRPEALLDGQGPPEGAGDVFQIPFRPRPWLGLAVSRLTAAVDAPIPPPTDRLEELVLETAAMALSDALALVPPHALCGFARRATREDLLGRVVRARDLIADAGGRVTLDRMADVACLSRYHFLRVFKAAFGATPAQYARRVRLERGLALLRRGGSSRGAARAAGFASVSAFLRSLRRNEQLRHRGPLDTLTV